MISLVDRFEKTCQLNQNFRALLRMRHFHDTVPLGNDDDDGNENVISKCNFSFL